MTKYKSTIVNGIQKSTAGYRNTLLAPTDPLLVNHSQWHLGFIGSEGFSAIPSAMARQGIESVWQNYQGDGVSVGIWDDGVQRSHWDLSANYDASKQVIIKGTLNNGQPLTDSDAHGTAVAGLIAADDNGLGGVGIAHDARITAVRIFGGADDINTKWDRYLLTLDSLKRFDVTNHSYGGYPNFAVYGDVAKFKAAAEQGRAGLGTVNVKSAGNDNVDGNGESLDASRFTVTVAAIGYDGYVAYYSTYGAHVLVSAPAGSVTTDLLGKRPGYNGLLNGDYTNQFGGTSAAGPVTAGVIALMLDANPEIGWRDVQNILAYSATGVGSLYGGLTTNENFGWQWNGAVNWNGGGLHFSEDYGYGMVNAFNAVRMSEIWSVVYPQAATSSTEASVTTGVLTVNQNIEDLRTLSVNFSVAENIQLEHVALSLSLSHSYFTDLHIRLISPKGTTLSLYDGSTGNGATSDQAFQFTFGADGFRGEGALGTWTLQVQDAEPNDSGILKTLAFTGYGSEIDSDSVYHFTDEILYVQGAQGQSYRFELTDTDEGVDWIEAAAVSAELDLFLTAGTTSFVGESPFMTIASDTWIENAIGGDGNDHIEGNAADNLIYGMRGDDMLWGGDGWDTAAFWGPASDYTITASNGTTTVSSVDGVDVLVGFEQLRFQDMDLVDPSSGEPKVDSSAPLLASVAPTDNSTGVSITSDIVLTFNEAVQIGEGLIELYKSDGVLIEQFDGNQMVISGDTVSINPALNWAHNTSYYILVEEGAILDSAENAFAGISDSGTLNFTTVTALNMVNGGPRSDRLIGTSANDLIQGFGGNDTISGKLGTDSLLGGSGQDTFVFDTTLSASNVDTVSDFVASDDTLRLENGIFSKLRTTGTLNSSFFRANVGGIAQDSNDYILFDTSTGNVYYDADGNGNGVAVLFVSMVELVGTLTRADFVVV